MLRRCALNNGAAIQNGHALGNKNSPPSSRWLEPECCRGGLRWRSSFVRGTLYQSPASTTLHTSPRTSARSLKSRLFGAGGFRVVLNAQGSASSYCSPMSSIGDIRRPAELEAAAVVACQEVPRCRTERARRVNCHPLDQHSGLLFSLGFVGPFFLE